MDRKLTGSATLHITLNFRFLSSSPHSVFLYSIIPFLSLYISSFAVYHCIAKARTGVCVCVCVCSVQCTLYSTLQSPLIWQKLVQVCVCSVHVPPPPRYGFWRFWRSCFHIWSEGRGGGGGRAGLSSTQLSAEYREQVPRLLGLIHIQQQFSFSLFNAARV